MRSRWNRMSTKPLTEAVFAIWKEGVIYLCSLKLSFLFFLINSVFYLLTYLCFRRTAGEWNSQKSIKNLATSLCKIRLMIFSTQSNHPSDVHLVSAEWKSLLINSISHKLSCFPEPVRILLHTTELNEIFLWKRFHALLLKSILYIRNKTPQGMLL